MEKRAPPTKHHPHSKSPPISHALSDLLSSSAKMEMAIGIGIHTPLAVSPNPSSMVTTPIPLLPKQLLVRSLSSLSLSKRPSNSNSNSSSNSCHARSLPSSVQCSVFEATDSTSTTDSGLMRRSDDIRNVAILEHVDHGKTTLLDAMAKQAKVFHDNQVVQERVVDSITYKNTKINIIDALGHSDFGDEVEHILNMVEGVLLVVDSIEGPVLQTKFALKKALEFGHPVIVVVNKIDRPSARPDYVINATFELFIELNATNEQCDFQVIYASAINGKAGLSPEKLEENLGPLFESIIRSIPRPHADKDGDLQMLATDMEYGEHKRRIAIQSHAGALERVMDLRSPRNVVGLSGNTRINLDACISECNTTARREEHYNSNSRQVASEETTTSSTSTAAISLPPKPPPPPCRCEEDEDEDEDGDGDNKDDFQKKALFLDSIGIDFLSVLLRDPSALASTSLPELKLLCEYLSSLGLSSSELRRIASMCPSILSLHIRDAASVCSFLIREAGVAPPDLRRVLHRRPRLLVSPVSSRLRPTLYFLQSLGIHDVTRHTDLLSCSVEDKLLPRIDYFQKLGFSYRDTVSMFRRFPPLFCYSLQHNFEPKFNYFVVEMGRELKELREFPQYFSFSLDKRIKPRHQMCVHKGVYFPLNVLLKTTEQEFRSRLGACVDSSLPQRDSPLWYTNQSCHGSNSTLQLDDKTL